MITQAEEGVIDKYIQQNFYTFKKNGADMTTTVPKIWLKRNIFIFFIDS